MARNPLQFSIKVAVLSEQALMRQILGAARVHLNKALHLAAPAILVDIRKMCREAIESTTEFGSLMNGELLGELGLPDVESRLKAILLVIEKSVQVKLSPLRAVNNTLTGGLTISILQSDFADVLGSPAAEYFSNEYLIPWLRWLLLDGDRIIIADYEIFRDLNAEQRNRSRTGQALMRPGKGWRVPPEYSGDEDDNFLTRAFSEDMGKVMTNIERIVSREIGLRL